VEDAPVRAEQLVKTICSLADPEMRAAYIRNLLQRIDISVLADLITIARDNADSRDPAYRQLLLYICIALADETCESIRESLQTLLESRGQPELALMLRRPPDTTREDGRVPDFGLGRPLTLGERKSLARRADRSLIVRVMQDPHPSVIRILLDNPGLTESDVVRLCARRPAVPEVQREVFRHRRWIVRYAVKVTIVLNRYTPLDIALQLAPHLNSRDRARVIAAEDLPQELRDSCQHEGSEKTPP
jgi:hypothetical protein